MWQVRVLCVCFLVSTSMARQLISDKKPTVDEYLEETVDLELDDGISENDNHKPEVNEIKEVNLEGESSNPEEEFELNENDLDNELDEGILEDLGDLVQNDAGELSDFPSQFVDASDMPTLDGRSCFTAWDNLKVVEPEIQIMMTQDPEAHPNKCLDDENDTPAGNHNPKIMTGSKSENWTTVKTPCYRSFDPEKKCSAGKKDCTTEGEAGYCDCPLYTAWEGQRFCCPQCACHPTLVAQDNLFKCACIFNTFIGSQNIYK